MSLFQEGALEVDNPQSREEDEEVEEQRRRQEELTDLLAAGIHPFNYDESTINSSATSFEAAEEHRDDQLKDKNEFRNDEGDKKAIVNSSTSILDSAGEDYKHVNYQNQLKVLYEVRVREINKLQNEFAQYKDEKSKEIGILKNKVILSEAEIRHLKLSSTNSEDLLVEKAEIINSLKQSVAQKDQEIEKLKKNIDELTLEICTYTATINELQLKQSDNNPFSLEARKFKSEELQKAHQDQVIKLETLLQEQSKKTQIVEKENKKLNEELKKLIKSKNEIEEENNLTVMGLSKKLQSSQQQCKDLYLLGEAIKKESDHFKERLQQLEINRLNLSGDDFKIKKLDRETIMVHLEKLKRMLLDRDVEISTLKAKLNFYDSDMDELFEYRKLLTKMYTCEMKPCNNSEHEELLIFMQRQLQSYQQAVEDRNNQIINLNMVNKELQEKIEEMIQQTRTDIQNLSQKYSLPQLETMSNELKNAEKTIHDLKKQLTEKNEADKSTEQELLMKLEKANEQNEYLQQVAINEKHNFEETLTALKSDMKKTEEEKLQMKEEIEKLTEENANVKAELQKICLKLGISEGDMLESDLDIHEISILKSKCGQVHDQLQQVAMHLKKISPRKAFCTDESVSVIFQLRKYILHYLDLLKSQDFEKAEIEEKLKQWDDILHKFIESLKSTSNLIKIKESELKDSVEDLTNAKTMLEGEKFALEYQLKSRINELDDAKREIKILIENKSILMKELENNAHTIQSLSAQLNEVNRCLQLTEENKRELERHLESTQKQLNDVKQETLKLHKEVNEVNENVVRKNLFKELKDVENVLEQSRTENDVLGTEIFQKSIQAEILKAELLLRERLKEENITKMQKIEEQYKNVLMQKSEMHNKEKERWKNQEAKYRKQFASVLEECGKKMEDLEKENITLIKQIHDVMNEYRTYRDNMATNMKKYKDVIVENKKNIEVLNKKWENLLEYYVVNFTNIEKQSQKKIKTLQKTISMSQTELNLIQSIYEEKMKKIKSQWKTVNKNKSYNVIN